MTSDDKMICERFKEIRVSLGMIQGVFAKEITLTQGHVSDIENKRKVVSDRIVEIICLKYGVSKQWLLYGIGDMFSPSTQEERYARNIAKLQRADDNTIMRWVNAISETNPEILKEIESFMKKILEIE